MAVLGLMPQIVFPQDELRAFGQRWRDNNESLPRTPPYSGAQLGHLANRVVSEALSTMLGGIPVGSRGQACVLT